VVYRTDGAIFNDLAKTPNPVYKITLYFDAEYLVNG